MIELTYDKAVELLERAVAEKGADYVYQRPTNEQGIPRGCAYFHGKEPGCIIGHVLSYLGLTRGDIGQYNTAYSWHALTHCVGFDVRADERTNKLLQTAQCRQDDGHSWGEAVNIARERTSETAQV